ncbi:MAG TPA: NAD(P)H-binding protein [Burkholderiaceae bacterium]|nr:NAD(P)H-binding protein [Burkholderiaceae bacterium]
MIHKAAVLAGATGLVGSRLVELLAAAPEYSLVVALARGAMPPTLGALQWRPADFERLADVLGDIRGSESVPLDAFCCLGTTIKAAGSQEAFRRVDFDCVVRFARWARSANARRLVVVTALGADPASRVFYNRVKGEAEQALGALGLPSLVVLRPSLLDGERAQPRPGEQFALRLTRPIRALLPRSLRPVRDVDVAATMLSAARADRAPLLIESGQMHGAAARLA